MSRHENKVPGFLALLAMISCAGCETAMPPPDAWKAWENSCRYAQSAKILRTEAEIKVYGITEKDQEVDAHTGKVYYESIYRGICTYNKDISIYNCSWQDNPNAVKPRYVFEMTFETLYDDWNNHVKDKNNSVVRVYAVRDLGNGGLMASSAESKISWPETFAGHVMETQSKSCGDELKAEDVLIPVDD